jgi:hypothetical protein
MAWEKRKRGSTYYTRSKKVNGKVIREYVGGGGGLGGRIGEIAAGCDELRRIERELEVLRRREEREKLEVLASPVLELCEATEVLLRAYLVDSGYRRVQGHWRRRRESRA